MNQATVRLIQNLPDVLRRFSPEQLYHLAEGLADELARRRWDAQLEARALELALRVQLGELDTDDQAADYLPT
jgi:hypothetical protein